MRPAYAFSTMPLKKGQSVLNCPVDKFHAVRAEIHEITRHLNRARDHAERADIARALHDQSIELLACEHADAGNMNCRLCHEFSSLRRHIASLILRMMAAGA